MSDAAPKRGLSGKVVPSGPQINTDDMPHPHSIEAERTLLGSIILDSEQIEVVQGIIQENEFYFERHQWIYRSVCTLAANNSAIDFTTLISELRKQRKLDDVGGPAYIIGLEQYVFVPQNAADYARIIHQKFQLRQLIEISDQLKSDAITEAEDVGQLLDTAEKKIFDLSEQRTTRDFQDLGTLTIGTMEEIDQRCSADHSVTGVATGYADLDEWTGGFQKSDLIILAARPSIGKTAFALNMAVNIGCGMRNRQIKPEHQRGIGIFSLEMSASQINMRLLSTISEIPMPLMRSGKLNARQKTHLHQIARQIHGSPIYVDDTPGISVLELRAKARRLARREPGLSMLIIDYLQLMRGSSARGSENRQQEVSEISRSLKGLARELEIPVIALSQLSRLIEQRKGKNARPILSDLRESGAIEQDADVVMFLHREKNFDRKDEDDEERNNADIMAEPAELIIGKQRNGPIGTIDLIFFRETATYRTLARDHNDSPGF